MTSRDLLRLALEALGAHRLRYGLSVLAIGVGVASVVLMVAIGEGTRRWVVDQVASFGTTLVSVSPGRVETRGVPGFGGAARAFTLADAQALARLPGVASGMAYAYGSALVEGGGRRRQVVVQGVTAELPRVWRMRVASGQFLPALTWQDGAAVAVLGSRLARELFGSASPIGERIDVAGRRFRVVGVLERKGSFLGFDMDDTVYLPVANAMGLFGLTSLTEVDLLVRSLDEVPAVAERARELMVERHGEEDVTVISQKDAMRMVSNVLGALTGVVAAIAGISLLVGAIGILTLLLIVVRERTAEIGLLRALGATRATVVTWFLVEAALIAAAGGAVGLVVGMGAAALAERVVRGLETEVPPMVAAGALVLAVLTGLVAGVVPALRTARLDPVEALRTE